MVNFNPFIPEHKSDEQNKANKLAAKYRNAADSKRACLIQIIRIRLFKRNKRGFF